MQTLLRISLLGQFECRLPTGEEIGFPTRKERALLAFLAMPSHRKVARERLAGLLWGERSEAQARANLRKSLSRLQQSLPSELRECIKPTPGHVLLDTVSVDAALFDRLVADGTPETLERAIALYRGPFLEGLEDCGESFDDWLLTERQRLEEALRQALHQLLGHWVMLGRIDPAIQVALRLLAFDPLEERVHRTLMRLYFQQDRVGAALQQYRRCREVLENELGIEPGPETERVRAEIAKRLPGKHGESEPELDDVPERSAVIESGAMVRARRRREARDRPSIAVLATGSDAEAPRHIIEGMIQDIATELGRFRELDVISPMASLLYRDARVSPDRIGSELGVDYILASSIRCSDRTMRTTVRLIESASGRQAWAERFDCRREEIFDVQDEVVRRIVGTLIGQIEDARLQATRRPEDWQAYDLWLRGWSALKRPDLPAIQEARGYFRQAVAKDPMFARAYVGLAMAHLTEWGCYSWNHWAMLRKEALELATRAVTLDERDHRALCMLGVAQLYQRDYEAARHRLLTAMELNPNDADVLAHASFSLALIGEHELGVEAGRRALRLAPHHPEWYASFAGIALFTAGQYEETIETLAPAPEAICDTPAFIAAAHAYLGRTGTCGAYRDTVTRHFRHQVARGAFPRDTSCSTWLLAMNPYRLPADAEHLLEGLRKAGFE